MRSVDCFWPSREHPVLSQGRNGDIQTIGVIVTDNGTDVDIQPITSKSKIGNCSVCLPSNPAVLRDLANKLNCLAKEIENNG